MTKPDLDHIRAGMRTHMIADESAAVMRLIDGAAPETLQSLEVPGA